MLNMASKVATCHKPLVMLFVFAAAIFFSANVTMAQTAVDRPWTEIGAHGVVDGADISNYRTNQFSIGVLTTGTVRVRYNIVAVDGVSRANPAPSSTITVFFRDSDCAGTTAQVAFQIRRTNLQTGGNEVLFAFDSNTQPCAGDAFQSVTVTVPGLDFDFTQYAYWVGAGISRTDAARNAQLGSIRIIENP